MPVPQILSIRRAPQARANIVLAIRRTLKSSTFLLLTTEAQPEDGKNDQYSHPHPHRQQHGHVYLTTVVEQEHPGAVYRPMEEDTQERASLRVEVGPGDEYAERGRSRIRPQRL